MLMSGLYRAVVSNPYGANVSEIRLEYSCKPPAGKVPNTPSKITVNLQEGSMLNESCGVTLQSAQQMYACITKNTSATFADLVNDSDSCAICNSANDLGRACSIQVNSGITNITVNRLEVDGCPPVQLMNFLKGDVTVEEDDGLRIICAYTLASYDQLEPYTSIHVRVSRPPNNHSSQVSVTIPVVCLVVALLVALMTLASCVLLRKRKRKGNHGE